MICSLLLVHGAGNGPWVFDSWNESFPGVTITAVDLQAGLDVARASMSDYRRTLVAVAAELPRPLALCGWSMGGLVALMSAAEIDPARIVVLEASPPAEIQGGDERIVPRVGVFDPEEVYGPFPQEMAKRPESQLARDERKRGLSVPSLPCPALVVSGASFPDDRGTQSARLYGAEHLRFPGLDHWALVLDPEVRSAVAAWLRA